MRKTLTDHNFMQYVEKRLDQWVRWFSRGNSYGIGFSSQSIEYTLMTVGIVIKSTAQRSLPCDEEAEEIEALVVEMAKHNIKMADALRIHYFERKKSRERSDEIDLSATQFKLYVNMAKQWLAGRLSAHYRLC